MLRVRAHAKINLALRVGPRGADGFHPVATVLQTVSLADLLVARHAPTGTASRRPPAAPLRLRVDGASLPETNTVTRAVELLADALAARGTATPALEMRLRKRVPLGAGLGGGSSDAAAALAACLRLWEPQADAEQRIRLLQDVAEKIGSDVPFFLYGGTALATGRGTDIEPLEALSRTWLVLAAPIRPAHRPLPHDPRPLHASTAAVYEAFDTRPAGEVPGEETLGASAAMPVHPSRPPYRPRLDAAWMGNDLAAPAAALHPEIEEVRCRLQELGAHAAQMSGSGAASFGAFADRRAASRAVARLRLEGVWAMVAVSVAAAAHRRGLFGPSGTLATSPA